MKKLLSLMLMIVILVGSFPCAFAAESAGEIKNIIYLIPDGGGYGPYDFANMVKIAGGFDATKFPTKTPTTTDPMTMRSYLAGSMTTACITGAVTDSAAAGTAMATGVKTINGFVGINKDMVPVANLVEAAESVGKATGIISTYHWAHATPATFTAHAEDRNDALNIYQQIENKDLEVVLGVGYGNVSQYATIQNAIDAGYTVVKTKEELLNVEPGDKIWGNVDPKGIPYDVYTEEGEPTLAEMTAGAIEALKGDSDGFFLMVEGGKVDTGGHANSANTTTSEYLAFDAAFRVAVDFAKGRTDTVVICAPDHDTGGMVIPKDPKVASAAVEAVMAGGNPSSITWESYSHTAQNVGVWVYAPEGVALIEGLNETLGDTPETRENYIIDNTDLAPWCADLMGVDLESLSEKLFVDVTTIGQYNVLERKFTFNNGDGSKYIYANQDEYYKDGETISLNGKTSMYLNNHFYVPAEVVDEEDWDYVTEAPPRDGITGTGTASDPYILDDAYDFMEFTANMKSGTTYSGKYIRQTKDIDLRTFTEYKGIGESFNFAGTYDGYGKKLMVSITSDAGVSVFPVVTGTLMNVGTEGTVTSIGDAAFAAGVAYYVGPGGKIVNCYSNATVKAAFTGGITTYNEGLVGNCSFCGTLDSSKKRAVPVGMAKGSAAEFWECYYLEGAGNFSLDTAVAVGETVAKTQLAETLNDNRIEAAEKLGFTKTSYVSYWNNDYGYPTHGAPKPIVESVTITPSEATVNKGEGIQLSAEVTGKHNPSQKVTWSIEGDVSEDTTITSDGYLTVSPEEKATSFIVMAKSEQDGGKVDIITVTVFTEEGEEPGGGEEPGESEKPDGSLEKPYLIETEADFKQFTDSLISGSTFNGKYFLQTADLDMSEVSGYLGAGSTSEFAGIYNGNGKKIKVNITSNEDVSVFPNLSGVIINLSTEGSVTSNKSNGYAAGLVYYIGSTGKIANCYSTAYVRASYAGGITTYSRGLVGNCAFFGSLRGGRSSVPVGITTSNATCEFWQCYYLEGTGTYALEVATAVTETTAKTTLAATLNANRNTVATKLGCDVELVSFWNNDYGYPQHGEPKPASEKITVSFTPATGGSVYIDNKPVSGSESFTQGEEITLKAVPEEGAEFKAWVNATTGKVVSTDDEYTFTAYTNRKMIALFADENTEDDVFVSFISKNNQYIYYSYLAKGTDVSTVAPSPEKMYVSGYTWNGFMPETGVVNVSTDYKGSYTKNADVYEIKISGGADKKGNTEIALGYNSSCTVVADAPDTGKVFTGWLINGKLASLNPEFTFFVFGDMTLEATYGTSLEDVPFVTLLDNTKWINGTYNMVSLTGTSYLPEGYTFSEAGILYVKAETDSETLVLENEGKKVSDKEIKRTSVTENQMFKLSSSYPEAGLTARGYLVYLDPEGERQVIYTDISYIHSTSNEVTLFGIDEDIDLE